MWNEMMTFTYRSIKNKIFKNQNLSHPKIAKICSFWYLKIVNTDFTYNMRWNRKSLKFQTLNWWFAKHYNAKRVVFISRHFLQMMIKNLGLTVCTLFDPLLKRATLLMVSNTNQKHDFFRFCPKFQFLKIENWLFTKNLSP